jgi:hypothetical protein
MRTEPFRKSYDARISEMETALRETHVDLGTYIKTCREAGTTPNRCIMLVYDNLLRMSNTMNTIKGFGPSIRFSDEEHN